MEQIDENPSAASTLTSSLANVADAVTSNETLKQWIPALSTIASLLALPPESKILTSGSAVRVAYQGMTKVSWNGETAELAGRTFEEAFAFQNLTWTQANEQKPLHLRVIIKSNLLPPIAQVIERIHFRVGNSSFKKTEFALALLESDPKDWTVPTYIEEGLQWLSNEVAPVENDQRTSSLDAATETA